MEAYLVFLIEALFIATPRCVYLLLLGKNTAAAITRCAQPALADLERYFTHR